MTEVLLNGYLKIEPVLAEGFMSSSRDTYEEIGKVIARDEMLCKELPLGSTVYFDSFMAKKYPIQDQLGKFQWYVNIAEIVKYEV